MAWKTIIQQKQCEQCGCIKFKKTITEYVYVQDVSDFDKLNNSLGGRWDEKPYEEHQVIYECAECGIKLN